MEENPSLVPESTEEQGDTSHALDLETVFEDQGTDAEMESMTVKSLLEANGIEAVLVSSGQYPVLPYRVEVARERAEEAKRLIAEAQAAGPAAAEEAELASETEPPQLA